MAGGGQMRTMGKDGMPATGVSDFTPLPSPPMSGGKGGGNGEMPRAMPAPAPSYTIFTNGSSSTTTRF